ncbi:MAG: response regulator [Treponema sp.]|jgi:putative two-component system response regulator|nr:response regulator [Treponema sp.]
MKTIFAVDDSDTNLSLTKKALEEHYRILTMPSAVKMFTLLEKITPDLILLDIEMTELNGVEAFSRLKASNIFGKIPVIFLTGRNDTAIEAKCFELGAVDFITKPFSVPVLLHRIKTYLNIDEIIHERTAQLQRLQTGIVSVLADIVESRDIATDGHIERTTAYIRILLDAMKERGVYADEIQRWDIETVILSARLHDMGKIVVSDVVLNKPDKLTGEEYETIRTHADEGVRIIDKMVEQTGEADFLQNAKLFAGYHHEYWDGSGYPHRLKGTDIPLQGRIMAIVDTYDALISRRSYKEAFSTEEAERIIMENAGTQFDPAIARVFFAVKEQFKIAAES